jgi:shikimate kinase
MPGCGKTTVGQLLSQITGREFVDTDELISQKYGRSPSEIIKSDGEESFRICEHEMITEIGKKSGIIIATGGGAVTREENKRPLKQNGKIVFIDRVLSDLATFDRPLSKNLESLYEKRLPLYRDFCDFEAENNSTPENCAKFIIEKLKSI